MTEPETRPAAPSVLRSALLGALCFTAASVLVYATVAFGEKWMYRNLGLYGAYAVWTALFVMLGGVAMIPVLPRPRRIARWFLIFGGSFFLYAAAWVAAYFSLRGSLGEWVGAGSGCVLLGVALAFGFGALNRIPAIVLVLFAANTVGYFAGSTLYYTVRGAEGMLFWGVAHGMGLGAGLGAAIALACSVRPSEEPNA